ncbi:LysR family transcriptional regulator, glycine cleavage system transcriptional activator [Mameliella alba]|uniref:LysR substrate-binding domain-containing protein n=1 Tax=Mameliella alba TaxID=561184 RepID=UPI00087E6C1A|nr:LysR substrate-binding domain-containing protein [Mameliella alba]OWV46691.1 LysR family transcriptional regulator [Mameliella alba]PTR37598.1 LysR family glycine cleavage system transcriptional activator [Mameliella alba]GGF49453.1 LysR family transcriptional regulator [Mameliella alba]SDD67070.1 LysR family transcriptional regulator, glycine cleavage system transcriptional activator [Mameliella alba]
MPKLPPLNALRAFEAAARHEGFIGAAEELHVTRGAVSRHVKLLEDHLGVPLFRRHAQGVSLSEAGRRFLPVLTESFARIAAEAERIASDASDLHIICPPATSIRWLLPRLDGFRQCHPEIRVRLTTDFHCDMKFDGLEYDLGFSLENQPTRAPNIAVQNLFDVRMSPACSPAYLASHPLERPEDLARADLLHETPRHGDWTDWLATYPVEGVDPAQGHDFANLDLATRAAVMGAGVVMADMVLCRDELEAGTLVLPFPEMVSGSPLGGICLLGMADKWDLPKVRLFREWVAEEAAG